MNFHWNPAAPIMSLEQVKLCGSACLWLETSRSKGMITTTSSLPQNGKPKGVQIYTITCSVLPTGWLRDKEFATPERPQMLAQPPYSLTCLSCNALTLALEEPLLFHQPLLKTSNNSLRPSFSDCDLTSDTIFADMAMLSERFQCWKDIRITHFYFDGGRVDR